MRRSQAGAPLSASSCWLVARLSSASRATVVTVDSRSGGLCSNVPRAGGAGVPLPVWSMPPPPQAVSSKPAQTHPGCWNERMLVGPQALPLGSRTRLGGIVKYQSEGMALTAMDLGHPVADLDARRSANARHGTFSDRNDGK